MHTSAPQEPENVRSVHISLDELERLADLCSKTAATIRGALGTPPAQPTQAHRDLLAAVGETRDAATRAKLAEEYVLSCSEKGGPGDPLANGGAYLKEAFLLAHAILMELDWTRPATRMIVRLRDKLLGRQREDGVRVNTGSLSQLLTETLSAEGDSDEAFRWALHTQAADMLARHTDGGDFARVWLYHFGITDEQRGIIDGLARRAADTDRWGSSAGFPEDVVRQLLRESAIGRELFAHRLLRREFPICRPYLKALWEESQETQDNDEQGRRLEVVAEYLFSLLPGCLPMMNVVDGARASEHDCVVANLGGSSEGDAGLFGRYFMVECKNWRKTVGSSHVGYFLFRLRQAKCHFGVMFAQNGISGSPEDETNARALVARSYRSDDVTCVVLSAEDIESLIDGRRTSFSSLLRSQLELLRYGKPRAQ